jgi:hypothetical protein
MTLTLEQPSHIYRVDGREVPGVTNTLRKAGILDYSMIPQDVLLKAGLRGTAVHKAMQDYALDRLDTATLTEETAGYVAAGIRFHEESGLVAGNVEKIIYNRQYDYAGMFDLDCVIQDELWLIDYKTGIVLDGHRAQLAAYANCRPKPRRYRRACVKLNADGSYRVHQYPRAGFDRDLDLFLFALAGQKAA